MVGLKLLGRISFVFPLGLGYLHGHGAIEPHHTLVVLRFEWVLSRSGWLEKKESDQGVFYRRAE